VLTVLVVAFLCAEPVLGLSLAPKVRLNAKAQDLEDRLSSIGKRAKHGSKSLMQKVVKGTTQIQTHHHKRDKSLEEEDAETKDILSTAEDDSITRPDEESKEEEAERVKTENKRMALFLVACLVTIIILGLIGYAVNKQIQSDQTVLNYFGFDVSAPSFKPVAIFVGMASGLVFGFIDNAGLFFGMEYLDPLFSRLPRGDEEKVMSGYGNTFSDCIGAFLGTFAGSIIKDLCIKYANYNESDGYPIWSEAVGITIGCIIGVLVPRAILGSPKTKRISAAQADALANGVTEAQIKEVMDEFDRLDRTTDTERPGEVRVENLKNATPGSIDKFIAQADKNGNNDGWVDRAEVLELLTKANKRYKSAQGDIINKNDDTTTDDGKALEEEDADDSWF
jgi:hypothetical protein